MIDNGWCRASYEEVHCAVRTAYLSKEEIIHDAQPALGGWLMDLTGTAAAAGERTGVIWTLLESDDLNANLVRFGAGGGVGEHINDEVDVIFVGVSAPGRFSRTVRNVACQPGRWCW